MFNKRYFCFVMGRKIRVMIYLERERRKFVFLFRVIIISVVFKIFIMILRGCLRIEVWKLIKEI